MNTIDTENNISTINDIFDIKLTEADEAIKAGAKFYTREEVDNILSVILKENV